MWVSSSSKKKKEEKRKRKKKKLMWETVYRIFQYKVVEMKMCEHVRVEWKNLYIHTLATQWRDVCMFITRILLTILLKA